MAASVPRAAPDRTLPGTRAWFVFFALWMIGWAAAALAAFHGAEQGAPLAWRLWVLALMAFYISLCNGFVPAPTAWIVLLAASPDFALVEMPALRVLAVAALATVATIVANLNEYHLLSYVLRFGLGRRVRRTQVYNWAMRWFDRAPFQLLALIAFVPIPVDAVRWLAILRGYPRTRFALAYVIGRGPRYVLFAWLAVVLEFHGWQIVGVQLALVGAALVGRVLWWMVGRVRRSGRGHAAQMETLTVAAAVAGPGTSGALACEPTETPEVPRRTALAQAPRSVVSDP